MAYIFEHAGRQFTPDGVVPVPDAATHNARVTEAELAEWRMQPDRWQGYVTIEGVTCPRVGQAVTLTTWTGQRLGSGRVTGVFRNNLTGSRTVAIRVRGTNGATYVGRFRDEWSQLCRVRRVRG